MLSTFLEIHRRIGENWLLDSDVCSTVQDNDVEINCGLIQGLTGSNRACKDFFICFSRHSRGIKAADLSEDWQEVTEHFHLLLLAFLKHLIPGRHWNFKLLVNCHSLCIITPIWSSALKWTSRRSTNAGSFVSYQLTSFLITWLRDSLLFVEKWRQGSFRAALESLWILSTKPPVKLRICPREFRNSPFQDSSQNEFLDGHQLAPFQSYCPKDVG